MIAIADGKFAYQYIAINNIYEDFKNNQENPFFFLRPLSHLIAIRKIQKLLALSMVQDFLLAPVR